jgi:hypothetical protein
MKMPTHTSLRERLDREPKGRVWNTLDWIIWIKRVMDMTTMMAAKRMRGRDWMMYLRKWGQGRKGGGGGGGGTLVHTPRPLARVRARPRDATVPGGQRNA